MEGRCPRRQHPQGSEGRRAIRPGRVGVGRGLGAEGRQGRGGAGLGTSCEEAAVQELPQARGLGPHAHQAHPVLPQPRPQAAEVARDPAAHHAAEAPQARHHARLLLPQAAQLHGLREDGRASGTGDGQAPAGTGKGAATPGSPPSPGRRASPPRSPRASGRTRPRGPGPRRSCRRQATPDRPGDRSRASARAHSRQSPGDWRR